MNEQGETGFFSFVSSFVSILSLLGLQNFFT